MTMGTGLIQLQPFEWVSGLTAQDRPTAPPGDALERTLMVGIKHCKWPARQDFLGVSVFCFFISLFCFFLVFFLGLYIYIYLTLYLSIIIII